MTNKDIYLSLNRQDETSVKKLLTNHKLEKEYTYNIPLSNFFLVAIPLIFFVSWFDTTKFHYIWN